MTGFKNIFNKIINYPQIYLFLSAFYPVIFLLSKNWFVYDIMQNLFLFIIPVLILILSLFLELIHRVIKICIRKIFKNEDVKKKIEYYFKKLHLLFLLLLGSAVIFVLLESSIFINPKVIYIFAVINILLGILIWKTGYRYLNLLLIIMTVISILEFVISYNKKNIKSNYVLSSLNKEVDDSIAFKKTPNIYLIHLESYHSPKATQLLYGFDNKEFVDELNKLGFYTADEFYSNYSSTLTSVGALFLQQHHYYKVATGREDAVGIRDMVGGRIYNPTLNILKNNNYGIIYLHKDVYNFMGNDYLDYFYPPNVIHDSLLIFQSKKIDWLRGKIFNIAKPEVRNSGSYDKDEFTKILWDTIEKRTKEDRSYFFYIKDAVTSHTPSNKTYTWQNSEDGWKDKYKKTVLRENKKVIYMVSKINDIDPEAIVILYGDHGAMLYRGIWSNFGNKIDINEAIYQRRGITGEHLANDMFGAFFAIKYPDGNTDVYKKQTLVNVFRILFSQLSENNTLLENMPANESYIYGTKLGNKLYRVVKDGIYQNPIDMIDNPDK